MFGKNKIKAVVKMITKLRGPENIMHRNKENPIIMVDDFPVPAHAIFNCGQTMYNGQTILLIAAHYKEARPSGSTTGIHVARSNDGIHFEIEKEPLFDKREWAGDCPGNFDNWVIDPPFDKNRGYVLCSATGRNYECRTGCVTRKDKGF